jgi:hypothetical protein
MSTFKSFGALGSLSLPEQMEVFGSVTKIKVSLVTGGRLWLPNVPDGSIVQELLKHRVGRSQVKRIDRVEVPA